jgi:hypothetical protein
MTTATKQETCVHCQRPDLPGRPLNHEVVEGVSAGFDETSYDIDLYFHEDCDKFWSYCLFCSKPASAERPTFSHRPKHSKAVRFNYHRDCGEGGVLSAYPWMFQHNARAGGSLAETDPDSITGRIGLIGEGIRIRQRAWTRLPENVE